MDDSKSETTIIVLPGSQWQVPLTKYLAHSGYRVLTINPYTNSPTFEYDNGHLQSDIFDIDAIRKYCKTEKAQAVISDECDIAMPTVAILGEQLNLHTLSSTSAQLFTDKRKMREFCDAHKFNNPSYCVCKSIEDVNRFRNSLHGAKIIIKPLDANSSRGVHTITSSEDVALAFEDAISFSKIEAAVLAEQYITGTEFTVDGIKTPRKHFTLAISKKNHYPHNENIAQELYFSHNDAFFDYEALKQINDTILGATSLEFGLTHCEYKYMDGNYYLIEMAARGGGNLISSHIVPYMSGFDNYAYLTESSLHGAKNASFKLDKQHENRCAVLKFFDVPKNNGKVTAIEGKDFLKTCKNILAYGFNFKVGDLIEKATNDAARIGFYIAAAESKQELAETIKTVAERVQILCV